MTWWDWLPNWFTYYFGSRDAVMIFLGLDNAGKTTMLHVLADNRVIQPAPTMHPSSQTVEVGGLKLHTFDMGGHIRARRIWKDYFQKLDGIVFFIDTSDPSRLQENSTLLRVITDDPKISMIPIALVGNKIDVPNHVGEEALVNYLGVSHMRTGKNVKAPEGVRPFEVFMISVYMKIGHLEPFEWLSKQI